MSKADSLELNSLLRNLNFNLISLNNLVFLGVKLEPIVAGFTHQDQQLIEEKAVVVRVGVMIVLAT